jgi:hypothetical protein
MFAHSQKWQGFSWRKCTFGDGLRAVFAIIGCFSAFCGVGTQGAIYYGMKTTTHNGGHHMTRKTQDWMTCPCCGNNEVTCLDQADKGEAKCTKCGRDGEIVGKVWNKVSLDWS